MELCVLAGPLSFQFSFCIRRRGCGHGQSGCGEILKVVEREMERGYPFSGSFNHIEILLHVGKLLCT